MPTPTPVIDSTVIAQAQKLLETTIQQGVVGFLLFIGFMGACFALAYLVKTIAQRNRPPPPPPPDPTAGSNTAISALAEVMTEGVKATNAANVRIDTILAKQDEKDAIDREQGKEQHERYIESISAQADATNNLADALKKLGVDNVSMKDDIHTMTTQGSKPLNDLIAKFDGLQQDVTDIKNTSENDHQAFELLLHDIAEMKAIVIRIDQRRATSEIGKVEVVNRDPVQVEVTNQ